ncbi:MAG: triple tyrosine motif-containing protein [Spirosomataceae bacterium]
MESLFLGGNSMLLSLYPNQLATNLHLPKIALTSFKKFEKSVLDIDSLLAKNQPIELDYNQNFFSFEWAALDYTNPSHNQFAYRLEGFDKNWIYIGTRRFIDFTNLNPGRYTLWIKAANNEGLWNEKGIFRLSLIIHPPFWQTWWFYVLLALIIMTLTKLLYDYRVRHLLAVERATLEENERVRKLAAQDLHDEFGNTLTRISLLTELIRNRMNGQATTETGELLTKISDNANRMYQGTKDFIWAINPEHDRLYEIAVRLKDFGDDIFDKTGTKFSVEGLTEQLRAVTLLTGQSRHLVLLFKEAMSNTLKHAQATESKLSFGLEGYDLCIRWQDNGKGFNPHQNKQGNGLANIQTRAEKIGGDIFFQYQDGTGMEVIFKKTFYSSVIISTHSRP